MRNTIWTTVTPALLLSLAGAFLSAATLESASGGRLQSLVAPLCGGDAASCADVLKSRWATFPPAPEQPADGKEVAAAGATGVPVGVLGLAYFSLLSVWLLLVGRPSWEARHWHLVPMVVAIVGSMASVIFLFVMGFVLNEWCPICVTTHLVNFGMLAFVLLAWPVRPVGLAADDLRPSAPLHPNWRLATATLLLGVALGYGLWKGSTAAILERDNLTLAENVAKLSQDADVLNWAHYKQNRQEIPIRPDDAMIPAASDSAMNLVLFTDLQCSYCRNFETELKEKILPQFQGQLQVVFKHFPLCSDCNTGRNVHPQACEAAYIAEAARLQGGTDAFFAISDLVKTPRINPWTDEEVAQLAAQAGLDAERLNADRKSDAVKKRVAEDVALARSLNVAATPTVFLEGRKLSDQARRLPSFWKLAAASVTGGENTAAGALAVAGRYVPKTNPANNTVASTETPTFPRVVQPLSVGTPAPSGTGTPAPEPATDSSSESEAKSDTPVAYSNLKVGQEVEIAGPEIRGGEFDLKQLKGKVVLVSVWGTYCPFCMEELPNLVRIHKRYAEHGFEILGVNAKSDYLFEMQKILDENDLKWPTIAYTDPELQGLNNPIFKRYEMRGVPTMFLVDRDGKVIKPYIRGGDVEPAIAEALGMEPVPADEALAERNAIAASLKLPEGKSIPPLAGRPAEKGDTVEIVGVTLDGKPYDSRQHRGKIVLVEFWATWCPHCRKAMPELLEMYYRYHDAGFEIVGISGDRKREDVEKYQRENQLPWPTLFFDEAAKNGTPDPLSLKYGVTGFPTLLLLDRDGKVIENSLRGAELDAAIARAVGKEPAPKPTTPEDSGLQPAQVPEIAGKTVDGQPVDVKTMRGKFVLLTFWGSWCPHCREEMPRLKALYERHHADGLEIVGISSDRDADALANYLAGQQLPWPTIYSPPETWQDDRDPISARYDITGYPQIYLLDEEGRVIERKLRGPEIEVVIARRLGKQPDPHEALAYLDEKYRSVAKSMISKFDTNKDGVITEEEWKRMPGNGALLDRDGDGKFDADELIARFKELKMFQPKSPQGTFVPLPQNRKAYQPKSVPGKFVPLAGNAQPAPAAPAPAEAAAPMETAAPAVTEPSRPEAPATPEPATASDEAPAAAKPEAGAADEKPGTPPKVEAPAEAPKAEEKSPEPAEKPETEGESTGSVE